MMKEIVFVTGNKKKVIEIQNILKNVKVIQKKLNLMEPQSLDVERIASSKAEQAYNILKKPVFVEDTSLTIPSLNNFPGAFIAWTSKTIGNEGLIKLMADLNDRFAQAKTCIAYCDKNGLKLFSGTCNGRISKEIRGDKGWGFDTIFIPEGYSKTWAELGPEIKNAMSHRRKAAQKFYKWITTLQ